MKKYNIAVDVISFGHVDENREVLNQFLNNVNNANNSSMLEVPVGFYIMDSLFTSPIMSESYDMPVENAEVVQQPSANQPGSSNVGMSQFEKDMNAAIQASLVED